MRITVVGQNKSVLPIPNINQIARKVIHAMLKKLSIGSLVLEENGQVTYFGNRDDDRVNAVIRVRQPEAWLTVLKEGSTGAGESFMHGHWETPDLIEVVRLFVLNMHTLQDMSNKQPLWRKVAGKLFHAFKANSLRGSKSNIASHYDLGNDFFSLFLDPTMAYSAAMFSSGRESLDVAAISKFDHLCQRLQLSEQDHLLEIGTGWGGLAIHAAKHYGCRVTTTTISHEQYVHACEWVKREGLEERIILLEQDYRELEGEFDKLVSVEMIEAVGVSYYDDYFRTCNRLLKPDGLMLIQAITISDQRYQQSVRNIDFIKRYIFPGGQLPCNAIIADKVATQTDMQLIGLEDITLDYALTIRHWRERFWERIEEVRQLGCDDVFIRMWHYYLCFCEGGFQERVIHTAQYLMAKPEFRKMPGIIFNAAVQK